MIGGKICLTGHERKDMNFVWQIIFPKQQMKRRNCQLFVNSQLQRNPTLMVINTLQSKRNCLWSHILKKIRKELACDIFFSLRWFRKKREQNCLNIPIRNVKFIM